MCVHVCVDFVCAKPWMVYICGRYNTLKTAKASSLCSEHATNALVTSVLSLETLKPAHSMVEFVAGISKLIFTKV